MTDPAIQKQIDYLDKLLSELRARYYSGDKAVEGQIRATAAKLEQLRLSVGEPAKPTITVAELAKAVVKKVTRRCCRG